MDAEYQPEVKETWWNQIGVLITQLCEHLKNHWMVYFKLVNFMACEFYLNFSKTTCNLLCSPNLMSLSQDFTLLSYPSGQGLAFGAPHPWRLLN
jgi:hypothetical protein